MNVPKIIKLKKQMTQFQQRAVALLMCFQLLEIEVQLNSLSQILHPSLIDQPRVDLLQFAAIHHRITCVQYVANRWRGRTPHFRNRSTPLLMCRMPSLLLFH